MKRTIRGLPIFLLLPILCAGCTLGAGTRNEPTTTLPLPIVTLPLPEGTRIGLIPFQLSDGVICGGHHEGLLQVRQPWQWGPTPEQNAQMRGDIKQIVIHSITDELKRQGLTVVEIDRTALTESEAWKAAVESCDLILSGTVGRVEFNTYGQGAGGFGSAGDYREAYVTLEGSSLYDCRSHKQVWTGGGEGYAKLPGSPLTLDWTFKEVIDKSKKMNETDLKGKLEASKASYTFKPEEVSVVDLAARLSIQQILRKSCALSDHDNQ